MMFVCLQSVHAEILVCLSQSPKHGNPEGGFALYLFLEEKKIPLSSCRCFTIKVYLKIIFLELVTNMTLFEM